MDAARIHRILRQHVETDRLLGVDIVPIHTQIQVSNTPATPVPSTAIRDESANSPQSLLGYAERAAPTVPDSLDREAKLHILQDMDEQEVRDCTKCELCRGRTQTVFGEGNPDAVVMFIGEGPGQTEDETGRPFVGKAGELLTKMIEAMGYRREDVYIANVVKCRPPNNRTPTPIEVQTCWDYLRRQIETIRPKVIVTVGGPASKMILHTETGITRLRGTWHQYDGITPAIPVMPTFHPAYLLRSYTRDNRQKVWSDLQQVMERVGKSSG